MNNIRRFVLLIISLFVLFFVTCKSTNSTIPIRNDQYVGIQLRQTTNMFFQTEGIIPILAWYGVEEYTIERYQELKEAEINYNFSFHANIENLSKAMDAAKEANVRMIIHCPELFVETENVVNRFRDHPALAGYFLHDEPNRYNFQYLGKLTRKIQAIDKKHLCYVNLFGDGAPPEYYGTETYREYIQLFVKEVPVQILSFDTYPIRIKSSGERYLTDLFYENLEIFSDEANKVEKPFWAFALTTSHWSFPIPTLADLRLQVYSNLAYGAQGIQYFTYWTPTPYEEINFHDGPINVEGQKTPTWYLVKQMNEEIKALSGVFLGAQVIKVEHVTIEEKGKNGKIPKGTTLFNFAKRPAEASIIKKFDIPNNTNAVVSFLKNGKRAYMVVINRNLSGGDDVTFTIEGDKGLQLIKKDGKAVRVTSKNSSQTVTPGDALIYGWNIK